MNWQGIRTNWTAFFPSIADRWPEMDEADLIEIDGDRDAFTEYTAKIEKTSLSDADEQIEAWLVELTDFPTDVKMDDRRDNDNIRESGRDIPVGEDVYSDDGRFGSGSWEDEGGGPTNPLGRTD